MYIFIKKYKYLCNKCYLVKFKKKIHKNLIVFLHHTFLINKKPKIIYFDKMKKKNLKIHVLN